MQPLWKYRSQCHSGLLCVANCISQSSYFKYWETLYTFNNYFHVETKEFEARHWVFMSHTSMKSKRAGLKGWLLTPFPEAGSRGRATLYRDYSVNPVRGNNISGICLLRKRCQPLLLTSCCSVEQSLVFTRAKREIPLAVKNFGHWTIKSIPLSFSIVQIHFQTKQTSFNRWVLSQKK